MYLTKLDIQIAYLLFCDWLKEMKEAWEKLFHLSDEQLLAPGYQVGVCEMSKVTGFLSVIALFDSAAFVIRGDYFSAIVMTACSILMAYKASEK